MEHVGEAIRYHRGRQGITQEELARRAGLSPASIVRLENGEIRNPRLTTLFNLSKALAINPAELVRFVSLIRSDLPPDNPAAVSNSEERTAPFTAVYQRDGDWWLGYIEELPGANAQERTLEEARESLKEAVELILEANRELTRTEFGDREVVREPLEV